MMFPVLAYNYWIHLHGYRKFAIATEIVAQFSKKSNLVAVPFKYCTYPLLYYMQ